MPEEYQLEKIVFSLLFFALACRSCLAEIDVTKIRKLDATPSSTPKTLALVELFGTDDEKNSRRKDGRILFQSCVSVDY